MPPKRGVQKTHAYVACVYGPFWLKELMLQELRRTIRRIRKTSELCPRPRSRLALVPPPTRPGTRRAWDHRCALGPNRERHKSTGAESRIRGRGSDQDVCPDWGENTCNAGYQPKRHWLFLVVVEKSITQSSLNSAENTANIFVLPKP